jgi:hypothetical protein
MNRRGRLAREGGWQAQHCPFQQTTVAARSSPLSLLTGCDSQLKGGMMNSRKSGVIDSQHILPTGALSRRWKSGYSEFS